MSLETKFLTTMGGSMVLKASMTITKNLCTLPVRVAAESLFSTKREFLPSTEIGQKTETMRVSMFLSTMIDTNSGSARPQENLMMSQSASLCFASQMSSEKISVTHPTEI